MSDAATRQPEHFGENDSREFSRGRDDGIGKLGTTADTVGFLAEIERYSQLSSDLGKCLSDMARRINDSLDELKAVRQSVVREKAEFESFMENQRRLRAEEKTLKEREDREYRESLKLRRQQEEEEYKRKCGEKQLIVRQKLGEELRGIHEQSFEKQKALERDLFKREQALKEKELELGRLIRELELFMTRLAERTRKDYAGVRTSRAVLPKDSLPIDSDISSDFPGASENVSDRKKIPNVPGELDEDENPSVASIREMLLSQGRKIENIAADLAENQESMPSGILPGN
jgi:hypothetical protein